MIHRSIDSYYVDSKVLLKFLKIFKLFLLKKSLKNIKKIKKYKKMLVYNLLKIFFYYTV